MLVPSHVQLFATPWTAGPQAPLSMGFFRQEYWSGLPLPPPGYPPDPGIKPASPVSLACRQFLYPLSHPGSPTEVIYNITLLIVSDIQCSDSIYVI